jgi:hypothetical protein
MALKDRGERYEVRYRSERDGYETGHLVGRCDKIETAKAMAKRWRKAGKVADVWIVDRRDNGRVIYV